MEIHNTPMKERRTERVLSERLKNWKEREEKEEIKKENGWSVHIFDAMCVQDIVVFYFFYCIGNRTKCEIEREREKVSEKKIGERDGGKERKMEANFLLF